MTAIHDFLYPARITTRTYICPSNLNIHNLSELFSLLPCFEIGEHAFGSKKTFDSYILENTRLGTIVSLEYQHHLRGSRFTWSGKTFKNLLTIVVRCSDKLVNLKVPTRGKMHITGALNSSHATECVRHFIEHITQYPNTFEIDGAIPRVVFFNVMTNICMTFPYMINIRLLEECIIEHTNHISLFEANLHYTAVRIKISCDHFNVPCPVVEGDIERIDTFDAYLQMLPPRTADKERMRNRRMSVMVFVSGVVIFSGVYEGCMRAPIQWFIDFMVRFREKLELRKLLC